jgi:hypothetical protein
MVSAHGRRVRQGAPSGRRLQVQYPSLAPAQRAEGPYALGYWRSSSSRCHGHAQFGTMRRARHSSCLAILHADETYSCGRRSNTYSLARCHVQGRTSRSFPPLVTGPRIRSTTTPRLGGRARLACSDRQGEHRAWGVRAPTWGQVSAHGRHVAELANTVRKTPHVQYVSLDALRGGPKVPRRCALTAFEGASPAALADGASGFRLQVVASALPLDPDCQPRRRGSLNSRHRETRDAPPLDLAPRATRLATTFLPPTRRTWRPRRP